MHLLLPLLVRASCIVDYCLLSLRTRSRIQCVERGFRERTSLPTMVLVLEISSAAAATALRARQLRLKTENLFAWIWTAVKPDL
jgi:hypothetical protein